MTAQRPRGGGGAMRAAAAPTTRPPSSAAFRPPPNPYPLTRPPSAFTRPLPSHPTRPLPPPHISRPGRWHPPTYYPNHYYPQPTYYGYYGPTRARVYISPWVSLAPVWWGPVLYPAGFGITWSSGAVTLSFSTYSPYYAYRPYYDSWYYNGWGYSSIYYGGWSGGWYGGFSYVHNPWPIYRTYYLYSSAPVQNFVYQEKVVEQPVEPAFATPPPTPLTDETNECFCACHCNGKVPCTCEYPCGSEIGDETETYQLKSSFVSYTVTLNPETIWASYAGFDRIN